MTLEMRDILLESREEIWLFLRQEQPKIVKIQSDKFFQDLENALEIYNRNIFNTSPKRSVTISVGNNRSAKNQSTVKAVQSEKNYTNIVVKSSRQSSDFQQIVNDNQAQLKFNANTGIRKRQLAPETVLKLIDDFGVAWEKATEIKPRRISGHKTPFVEAAKVFLNIAGINKPEPYLRQFLKKLENV